MTSSLEDFATTSKSSETTAPEKFENFMVISLSIEAKALLLIGSPIRGRFCDCPTDEQAKAIIRKCSKCDTVADFQLLNQKHEMNILVYLNKRVFLSDKSAD